MSGPVGLLIVGDVRSGTTLLQGLLALHAEVAAVGEIRRLERFVAESRTCDCGEPVSTCPHWLDVAERLAIPLAGLETGRPASRMRQRYEEASLLAALYLRAPALGRLLLGRRRRVADTLGRLLRASAEREGARVVVDSSKDPGHALLLLHQTQIKVFVTVVVRDGRAVVSSKMRRTGISVETAARHWLWVVRGAQAVYAALPENCRAWIRYEDLCAEPRALVTDLGARTGFDVGRLREPGQPRHAIGGSPGFGEASFDAIVEDLSWKNRMSADDLAAFERIAGRMNAALGYS